MDCLLCYKVYIKEKEFENYNQNPRLCKKAILKLFRISSDPKVQGLSEELVLCRGCHRKLEDVEELMTQLEELQRMVDKAKTEIKQGLIESKKVSEVIVKDFEDSMSKSSLDRLVLLKAIDTNARPPATDQNRIDVGGTNESFDDQQFQDQVNVREISDLSNEREGLPPSGATWLKLNLERLQILRGVSTVKQDVKSHLVPSSSNRRYALRNPKPAPKTSTVVEGSSNKEAGSESGPVHDSSSEDDPEGESEAKNMSNGSSEIDQEIGKLRSRGYALKAFTLLKNGSFKCKHCSKIIIKRSTIWHHYEIHQPRRFKCSVQGCGKAFTKKFHLNDHVKIIHEKRRDFKCGVKGCGKEFPIKNYLQTHMAKKHKR